MSYTAPVPSAPPSGGSSNLSSWSAFRAAGGGTSETADGPGNVMAVSHGQCNVSNPQYVYAYSTVDMDTPYYSYDGLSYSYCFYGNAGGLGNNIYYYLVGVYKYN